MRSKWGFLLSIDHVGFFEGRSVISCRAGHKGNSSTGVAHALLKSSGPAIASAILNKVRWNREAKAFLKALRRLDLHTGIASGTLNSS